MIPKHKISKNQTLSTALNTSYHTHNNTYPETIESFG